MTIRHHAPATEPFGVAVAQLVEPGDVTPAVVGSNPTGHPQGLEVGRLVYDTNPEIEYDPRETRTPAGLIGSVRLAPDPQKDSHPRAAGFGNGVARRMLEAGAPPKHPWLTVDVARQELAMQEYARDRAAVALDSVE